MKKISQFTSIILLTMLIYFNNQSLTAQDFGFTDIDKLRTIRTNAPTTAGLGRFGEYPVNNVYGLPNINIPLLEYSSGDIMQKINLSYHAGGIKVRDRAGWVGLGWSLFAGGVITVNVNGSKDLAGYFDNAAIIPDIQSRISRLLMTASNTDSLNLGLYMAKHLIAGEEMSYYINMDPDCMPDVYNINTSGISGSFVFNSDWEPVLTDGTLPIEVEDISNDVTSTYASGTITVTVREDIYGFKITDKDGYIYLFGGTDGPSSAAASEYSQTWPNFEEYNKKYYTSAFYLSKILSPDGKDYVEFFYESDVKIEDDIVSSFIYHSDYPDGRPCKSFLNIVTHTKKLSQIKFKNGRIRFCRSTWQTGEDRKLNSIVLYKEDGTTAIKYINFHYDFFTNEDETNNLKLTGISVKGKDNVTVQQYSFDYNPMQLPGRTSNDLDHWGYYNGANNLGNSEANLTGCNQLGLIPRTTITVNGQNITKGYGDREPYESFTQACILKKIHYPTGGYTEFEYENHKTATETYGGLRIKRILNYSKADAIEANTIKEYYYSGGYLLGFNPNIGYPYVRTYNKNLYNCRPYNGNNPLYSESAFYSDGRGIYQGQSTTAYTQVTEKMTSLSDGSLGSTVYEYPVSPDEANYRDHIFAPFQSKASIREKVRFIGYYDKNTNPVKETEYLYNNATYIDIASGFTLARNNFYEEEYEVRFDIINYYGCTLIPKIHNSNFSFKTYSVKQYKTQLNKTIEKNYSLAGTLIDTTKYFYAYSGHPFPVRIVKNKSNGDKTTIIKKYPLDYCISSSSTPIYNQLHELREKHVLSAVINQSKLVKYDVTNCIITEYQGLYPKTIYSFESENKIFVQSYLYYSKPSQIIPSELSAYMNPKIHFTYDDNKLVTRQKENDIPVSYIWGYNETYPIAKVANASTSQIAYTSFEEDLGFMTNSGNWKVDFGVVYDDDSKTGKKCFSGLAIATWNDLPIGKYRVSFFAKNNGDGVISLSKIGKIIVNNTEWTSYEYIITLTEEGPIGLSPTGAKIDELRLYPSDAQMTTYAYEPLIGMTSQTDENGLTTTYDYDDFGRLKRVLNDDDDILEENVYHYANHEGGEPDMLLVGPDLSFNCSPLGSSKAFSISSNITWTVTSSETWVELSAPTGSGNGRLTIICPENAGNLRTATVTIQANGISYDITITQDAGTYLNLSPGLLFSIEYLSGSKTYNVSSNNISWEVTKSTGDSWIQLSNTTGQDNGSFNITCTQNNGSQRSGTVTVEGGDFTREIAVVQYKRPPFFELGPDLSFVCNYQTNSKTFNVSSNIYWSITKSAGDDWIQLSRHPEQGNGSFNITCTENDNAQRTGTVTVAGEGFSYDITVFQYSYPISVSPTNHTFVSSGGNKTFTISPVGTNFSAHTNDDWLTIISVTTKNITVTCSDIKTLPPRSGSIKIIGESTSVDLGIEPQKLTINISQF